MGQSASQSSQVSDLDLQRDRSLVVGRGGGQAPLSGSDVAEQSSTVPDRGALASAGISPDGPNGQLARLGILSALEGEVGSAQKLAALSRRSS